MPNIKNIGSTLAQLASTPVGKKLLERMGYGAAGYGTGAAMERIETAHGKKLSPEGIATMRMAPALVSAIGGPWAMRRPNPVIRAFSSSALATAPAWISSVADPGKKALGESLESARSIGNTVPRGIKTLTDAVAGIGQAITDPYDPAGSVKRILEPSINTAVERVKSDIVPPLSASLSPAIKSTGRMLMGGTLGTLGGYGLADWLLPKVKVEDSGKRMSMTSEQLDEAYHKRQRSENNRKALAVFLSTLAGGAGMLASDPSVTKDWWNAISRRGAK